MTKTSNSRSVLVTMGDVHYIPQIKQLFSSALIKADWQGDVLLLTHNLPKSEVKWFTSRDILVKQVPLIKHPSLTWFPAVYLLAFEVFTQYFKKWDSVVFIEGDVIIQHGLKALTQVSDFSAVPEIEGLKLKDQFLTREEILNQPKRATLRKKASLDEISALKKLRQLESKYNLSAISFNAGVFSFPSKIISSSMKDELLKLAAEYSEISAFGMQGIFNLYFSKKWQRLPILYNYCINLTSPTPSQRISSKIAPVVHFAGCGALDKPWVNTNSPYFSIWKENLDRASALETGRSKGSALNVPLFLAHIISFFYLLRISFHKYSQALSHFVIKLQQNTFFISIKKIKIFFTSFFMRQTVNFAILVQLAFAESKIKKNSFPDNFIYYVSRKSDLFVMIISILSLNHHIPGLNYRILLDQQPDFLSKYVITKLLSKLVRLELLSLENVEEKIIPKLKSSYYAKSFFNYGWAGKKFFIPLFLEEKGSSILIDSDTLFTAPPDEIAEWLKQKSQEMLFLSDYANFSVISLVETDSILKKKHRLKNVNSGLLLFPLTQFHKRNSLKEIDQNIKAIIELNKERSSYDYHTEIELIYVFPILEQSLHTLIAERLPHNVLDRKKYQVFPEHALQGKDVKNAHFMHFTGDIHRYQMYKYLFYSLFKKTTTRFIANKGTSTQKLPWFIFSRSLCINCQHPVPKVPCA